LFSCTEDAKPDSCEIDTSQLGANDITCGPIRDCIQTYYGTEADLRRRLSVRPILIDLALVHGRQLSCPNGVCTSLLSCIEPQPEPEPSPPDEIAPPSLVDTCNELGIDEVWFGIEPMQTLIVVGPDSAEISTFPPEYTASLPCADAMVRGGALYSNGGRVVISMYAKGTFDNMEYCWLLAQGSTDARAQLLGEDAFLPIRSVEQLLQEASTALPCTEVPS
jgi:hypothetical protein